MVKTKDFLDHSKRETGPNSLRLGEGHVYSWRMELVLYTTLLTNDISDYKMDTTTMVWTLINTR